MVSYSIINASKSACVFVDGCRNWNSLKVQSCQHTRTHIQDLPRSLREEPKKRGVELHSEAWFGLFILVRQRSESLT